MIEDRKRLDGIFWCVETRDLPKYPDWYCVAKKDTEAQADALLAARASYRLTMLAA